MAAQQGDADGGSAGDAAAGGDQLTQLFGTQPAWPLLTERLRAGELSEKLNAATAAVGVEPLRCPSHDASVPT